MGTKGIAAALALFWACGDSASPQGSAAQPARPRPTHSEKPGAKSSGASGASGQASDQGVELAEKPALDLVDNRYLWHLYGSGLILPLASEGIRKYNHEYSRPWSDRVELAGAVGRVLERRQSTLVFRWFDEPAAATLHVRAHGLAAGQRVTAILNGKRLGDLSLEDSWRNAELQIPAGVLRRGENSLRLHVGKRGRASGKASYGLWRWIEIRTEEPAEPASYAELQPATEHTAKGERRPALTGFSRMVHLVEIPESAWLEVFTAGEGTFSVRAKTAAGNEALLFEHESKEGGWVKHQVDLAELGDTLVALELRGPAKGYWGSPRIALAPAAQRTQPEPAQNAILLVVDALRSDHVPFYEKVYGKGRSVAMPHATERAAEGSVVFLHNQAASPSSPPSHGSIQTGMIPRVHGVAGDKGALKAGTPMISTQVAAAGISAGYYGNNPFGMGRLEAPGQWTAFHQPGKEGKSNDCTTLVEMMLEFAAEQNRAGKRFFISSLPYETHTPYRYHEGITENYYKGPFAAPLGKSVDGHILGALSAGTMNLSETQWQQLRGLYRGEAEYWDQCFGALVEGLEKEELLEDTALILTSDHGEGMYEHGKMGHAFGHYRELGDVPFVIFWPKLLSSQVLVDTVTTHRDIAPTILDLLDVPVDERVQGQSVLPLALRKGPWIPRVVSLEYGRSYSLRSKRYKLIVDYNGGQEAYDLQEDPWEKRDLLQKDAGLAVGYLRDLMGFFLEYRSRWRYRTWGTLNRHRHALVQAAHER